MRTFFIPQKLSLGDTTHLSDKDSIFAIKKLNVKIEDILKIENYQYIFNAIVVDITKNSVEVEISEIVLEKEKIEGIDITVIQSLSNESKFNYFLEKATEIGVDRIIPIESSYSLRSRNKAIRDYGLWKKIVRDATEQSRTQRETIIEKPIKLNQLQIEKGSNRVCLATENIQYSTLDKYIKSIDIKKPFVIAIGPEKGWSIEDLEIFKGLDFKFVKLNSNILRTETAGLVISSVIKYLKGEL
ncbi:MAG: RsmE family RNA methyltransferase [Candidatus Dojkabacteria bacterium]